MKTAFTTRFISAVQAKIPPELSVPQVLGDLLGQSASNLYRKLRGDVPFTLEEVLKIAHHFSVSIDACAFESPSWVVGELPAGRQAPYSPVDYLALLEKQLMWVTALPQAGVLYAAQEVPVFYYLLEPELLAFKLFMWGRTNGHTPDDDGLTPFHPDTFQAVWPGLEPLRSRVLAAYFSLNTEELWTATLLEHTLRQIAVARYARMYESSDTAERLYRALLRTLEHMEASAAEGKRPGTGGGRLALYFNDVAYTNNTVLVIGQGEPVAVFSSYDNPYFLVVRQSSVLRRMHTWLNSIRQQTMPISVGGERLRHALFAHYRHQVMAAWEKNDRGEFV